MFLKKRQSCYVGIAIFLLLSTISTIVAAQPDDSSRTTILGTVRPEIENHRLRIENPRLRVENLRLRPLIASWWPPIFTLSCDPKPPGILDIYDEERAQVLSRDKNVSMFVAHGIAKIADKPGILMSVERVPIFVSARNKVGNLSSKQLTEILRGQITDWKDLGGEEGRIRVYLHKGELQKKSFEKFSELSLQINPNDLPHEHITYGENYKKLEAIASQDENALVIGLRKLKPENLKTVSINGVFFSDDSYPLTLPVYLYKKDTPQANDLSIKFVESMSKKVLRNRIIEYPANIR